MKFNEQQEKILKDCYDFIEKFETPKDQKDAMVATAEYALKMETIKTLEAIRVAYANVK